MDIIIIILLILVNGIFSMSEIALISVRKSFLVGESHKGSLMARTALKLANDPDKFLSTVQIGITLIGILTGIYSGDALADDFAKVLTHWGCPLSWAHTAAQGIIVFFVTYFSILFGELLPKRIGMSASSRLAKLLARPMYWLSIVASPFVWLLSESTGVMLRLLHINMGEEKITEAEIKSMIEEGVVSGEVQEVEHHIMNRVFSLGDRSVSSIMTYRSDITTLDESMSANEIFRVVSENLFQVYPVTRDRNLDDIVGVVYLKDLYGNVRNSSFRLTDAIRPAQFFPEHMDVYRVLEKIRETHVKYGLICDEYGNLQGIITLKDIMEALVGDLPGEEHEEPDIITREDGSWLIDGQCSMYDFLRHVDKDVLYDDEDFKTLGGLILHQLGYIPHIGERLQWDDFLLEVVDMDGVRIDKVLVTRRQIE